MKDLKKAHETESFLVDALLQMSSTSYFLPPEKVILDVAKSGYGPLSKEFEIVYNEISNGESWKDALIKMKKRIKSKAVEKAVDVLIISYESGGEMGESLREVAEEISSEMRIQRQRNSAIIIQKMTLIIAGAFIIPLILGVLISMIRNFDFNGISEFGLTKMNLGLIIKANEIYLVEYGLLAAGFISYQERRKENFVKYFLLIVPVGILLFNLAKAGLISLF